MSAREHILDLLNQYSYTVDGGDLDGFDAALRQQAVRVDGV